MVALAGLYLEGEGAIRDPRSSLMWASVAASQASGETQQQAARLRDQAAASLSEPEQVAARARRPVVHHGFSQ